MGVDPANRDGTGVSAENVHALGSDIAFMGWSWGEVRQPVCIEEAPDSTFIRDFNVDLVSGSPLLPPVVPDSIRYGSLSHSHTHMYLRCVEAGVSSDQSNLTVDGRLSLVMLEAKDKEFANAVHNGLKWTVLNYRVRARVPPHCLICCSRRGMSVNRLPAWSMRCN